MTSIHYTLHSIVWDSCMENSPSFWQVTAGFLLPRCHCWKEMHSFALEYLKKYIKSCKLHAPLELTIYVNSTQSCGWEQILYSLDHQTCWLEEETADISSQGTSRRCQKTFTWNKTCKLGDSISDKTNEGFWHKSQKGFWWTFSGGHKSLGCF